MLSLLSLLLASGTVLRADTERWTPAGYPNPRRNHTACNSWPDSTLCDPDHILTDQWRAQINENIRRQMKRLTEADVPLAEKAPPECANRSEGVTIYVLLAKRIWAPNNQSITGNDLTTFGDELAKQYGLNEMPCKTFLLLIGIEAAKLAYVRTGKDLKLPTDLMQRVFQQYKLFNAKNFMAGLNKIVDEIGTQMADPFKDQTSLTTAASSRPGEGNSTASSTADSTTLADIVAAMEEGNGTRADKATAAVDGEVRRSGGRSGAAPIWMFFTLGSAILLSFGSLALLAVAQQRRRQQLQEQQQLAISKRQTTANAGSGNGVIRASAKVGKTTGSCHRTDERKLRNGPANDDQAESRSRPGANGKATQLSVTASTASSLGDQSEDGGEFDEPALAESARRVVRIDAAELATDDVIMKDNGSKKGKAGDFERVETAT